jgi:uncharacterized protein
MHVADALWLVPAGFAAGAVNAIAGGGSLITFPTLIALGFPPITANVTNSVAVTPGYLGSVAGSRADLAELAATHRLLPLGPTAMAGGAAGCLLLLTTPARAFDLIAPFLVLGAAALIAVQPRLRAMVARRSDTGTGRRRSGVAVHAVVAVFAAYGGYFGAALGVMLLATLGLVLAASLRHINALKNAISAVVALVTVAVFGVFGPVDWVAVAIVAPTTSVGGFLGARWATRLSQRVLRAFIVAVGAAAGLALLGRALAV